MYVGRRTLLPPMVCGTPEWRSSRWADTATVSAVECDEYQRAAMRTARDKNAPGEFMHLVLGLVGEAGEVAEKVKKLVRDKNGELAQLDLDDMAAELGDVLWYTAVLANFLGLSLDDVAQRNVDKLADRQRRAVLGGSGDNR
jgi:NTP pyrophosphatase (non-canonical NTP hydrolase)